MEFQVVHIHQTESTNIAARQMIFEGTLKNNFCLVTEHQIAGRGQLGTSWQSEKGKNLTFSLALQHLKLPVEKQFVLSALVSLNLIQALNNLGFFKVQLKWPNDIISNKLKIAGVLIETIIQNSTINTAIIGIGLNVNQTEFKDLPKASSLKNSTGIHYNLEEVLQEILVEMQKMPFQLKTRNTAEIYLKYQQLLFRNNKASMFEFPNGSVRPGIIKGVKTNGSLRVLFEDEHEENFDVKEIKLLY
jgi:BirA family biotin operon repressor/biotin-[acetyl-CoA-carboxylase] ligase